MNTFSKILVLITCIGCGILSCRKDPLDYTYQMTGTHQLTGFSYDLVTLGAPISISFTDSVYVINNSTIIYKGYGFLDTMHCSSTDKKNKKSTFTYMYKSPNTMPLIDRTDTVIYKYSDNSILYSKYSVYNNYKQYLRAHN